MKIELGQEDASDLSTEDFAALHALIEGFQQERGLLFGYTVLAFDKTGIKTIGNMPPEAQQEMFAFVANQLATDGPDSMETIHSH